MMSDTLTLGLLAALGAAGVVENLHALAVIARRRRQVQAAGDGALHVLAAWRRRAAVRALFGVVIVVVAIVAPVHGWRFAALVAAVLLNVTSIQDWWSWRQGPRIEGRNRR
jgi:hypothetical protein